MRDKALLTDLYQLTMINGYLEHDTANTEVVFDLFFRKQPGGEDFAIVAGLEQAVEYLQNLSFSESDIKYLKSLNLFGDKFFNAAENFKFTGDVYAMREGEIVFPQEPILIIKAPLYQAQLIETALLTIINHQTLIATKAYKVTQETGGAVSEFGLRRAQGPDAGVYGARASIIGGCTSTSNVLAGKLFDVPVSGTHSHSWVLSFSSELEAFESFAKLYPSKCVLLVDTYDTLRSGVPNAIKVFKKLREKGYEPIGIRLDSGDLAYLSKQARKMLDEAGFPNAKIVASNDIDENIIASLNAQGAKIDLWGVGTKLITSYDNPSLGGVYKLSAIEDENNNLIPKMKLSDTQEKTTNPGFKTTYRLYDKDGMAVADLIALREEKFDTTKPLTIFHPVETWKRMTLEEYSMRDLMVKVFEKGKLIYKLPKIDEIVSYSKEKNKEIWSEYTRRLNPHIYKVDLSTKLYNLKQKLLNEK
ncbi:MAG: nicotinate phosphoribosyltransferase [Christensenellales bacterium]|nr:nicotinate phosphoribosyltransferase [Clostridiales bacterium]